MRCVTRIALCYLGGLLFAAEPPGAAVKMEPQLQIRGGPVTISIPNAPDSTNYKLLLENREFPATWQNKRIEFAVPAGIPFGKYGVLAIVDRQTYPAGTLTVAASLTETPKLEKVEPKVMYLKNGTAEWTFFGKGFAADSAPGSPGDIKLLINGSERSVHWHKLASECTDDELKKAPNEAHGIAISSSELKIYNVAVNRQGTLAVDLWQGGSLGSQEVQVTRWGPWTVRGIAFGATALITGLVYFLLSFKGEHLIRGRNYRLRALFLDKQTNTYSLSILQFHLWTLASLFGYAYFALARMFVQRAGIPEVSDNLPGIIGLGIGAGTGVGAQLVSLARPKGSGEEVPSPSDLVTSGGAVAPDRVQMLVWTLVGVGVFLGGVLRQEPSTIQQLPGIPESLLALMGLGSLGYLGGKFARKPGPNILEISVIPAAAEPAGAAAPAVAVDLSPASAAAAQTLQMVKTAAAGLTEGSAPVAVREAVSAVAALEGALAATAAVQKSGRGADGLPKLAELSAASHAAAVNAAREFDAVSASAGSEVARVSAVVAQRAAAAVEDLSATAGSAVANAEAAAARRARETAASMRRVIELRGLNLSAEGIFRVKVGASEYDIPFRMLEEKDNRRAPEIVVREESTGTPNLARTLRLTIVPSQLEPADRKTYDAIFGAPAAEITFSIFNPDGQRAVKTFSMPPGEAQRS